MPTRIGVYKLRIMGPDFVEGTDLNEWDNNNQKVIDSIDFAGAEVALNNDLPDGYYAKVED